MYEVFINEKKVLFVTEYPQLSENPGSVVVEAGSPKSLKIAFFDFINTSDYNTLIINAKSDIEKTFGNFVSLFWYLEAAGGLVRNPGNERLFIFRFGKWDLPKGKIEKGETTKQAALREVTEETGISGQEIIKELPATYHIYEHKGKTVFKKTYWYAMNYHGDLQPVPQSEESITEAKWFKNFEINTILSNTYKSLYSLIETGFHE